jgi:hypothetical protein
MWKADPSHSPHMYSIHWGELPQIGAGYENTPRIPEYRNTTLYTVILPLSSPRQHRASSGFPRTASVYGKSRPVFQSPLGHSFPPFSSSPPPLPFAPFYILLATLPSDPFVLQPPGAYSSPADIPSLFFPLLSDYSHPSPQCEQEPSLPTIVRSIIHYDNSANFSTSPPNPLPTLLNRSVNGFASWDLTSHDGSFAAENPRVEGRLKIPHDLIGNPGPPSPTLDGIDTTIITAIMRSSVLCSPFIFLISLLSLLSTASAIDLIESNSLNTCQANSSLTASLFNVVFTPGNRTLTFDIVAVSSIQGDVIFDIQVTAYGLLIIHEPLNPCNDSSLSGLCPMTAGQIDIPSNIVLSQSTVNQIPSIAYNVPDLDANVMVQINSTSNPDVSLACVQASLSNGKTVYQKGVGWATAVVAGLALVASAVTSGLGHSNTAVHVAANALSLFGYFQGQAIIGMTAVPLPPIVQSWTQNFDWSMGIIEIGFMQSLATWYQKSTGGTPSTLLNTLTTTSVQVEKRSLRAFAKRSVETSMKLLSRANELRKRASTTDTTTGTFVVKGMTRVAFRAGIESTNLFLTGLIFFCVFIFFTILFVALFKGYCEMAVRAKWMKSDRFQDFRNGWLTVLKGIMFRIVLIGYPQMTILCMWEFTQDDSPAEIVLGVFFFFGMTGTLIWAAAKVILIARRSVQLHKNPAYILYSDPSALNKWGFLYVQFRATAYYFIVPELVYIVIKGMFIALGQNSGTLQAVALVIIEAIALVGTSVLRPWMDKPTNSFNISICAINFVNAIFLLVFTGVFNLPGLVTGVMGIVFFVYNAAFALVLIILVLIATAFAFVRKNPDSRYQPVADDRASFIKSQTQLTTELDALAATARGDTKEGYKHNLDLDEDEDSWSSDSMRNPANHPLPPSTSNSYREPPHSPIDPSVPLFPAGGRGSSPMGYQGRPESRPNSDLPLMNRSTGGSPSPYGRGGLPNTSTSNLSAYRVQNNASPAFRSQNNAR